MFGVILLATNSYDPNKSQVSHNLLGRGKIIHNMHYLNTNS